MNEIKRGGDFLLMLAVFVLAIAGCSEATPAAGEIPNVHGTYDVQITVDAISPQAEQAQAHLPAGDRIQVGDRVEGEAVIAQKGPRLDITFTLTDLGRLGRLPAANLPSLGPYSLICNIHAGTGTCPLTTVQLMAVGVLVFKGDRITWGYVDPGGEYSATLTRR